MGLIFFRKLKSKLSQTEINLTTGTKKSGINEQQISLDCEEVRHG